VSAAREQVRFALTELVSFYAREKGFRPLSGASGKSKRRASRLSARTRIPHAKTAAFEPDLIWLDGKRVVWKFYVFPERATLRRLNRNIDFAVHAIVCEDSAGNLGIIEPSQFLSHMSAVSSAAEQEKVRSLTRDIASVSIPYPDFHFKGTVRKNSEFVKDHFSLCIQTGFVHKPAPGQFLQVLCDPGPHDESTRYRSHRYSDGRWPTLRGIELLDKRPFLRRPFSIASYGPPHSTRRTGDAHFGAEWMHLIHWVQSEFEIIYRRLPEGPGTTALARDKAGDTIDIVGPLGRGFTISPLPKVALLVGGGIGSPPLVFLANELLRNGVEAHVFLGAVTASKIPFRLTGEAGNRIARFERMGISPVVSTDDGSAGRRGLVTEALVEYLEKEWGPSSAIKIFACGPRPMLAALDGIAGRYKLPCEALLEERMACGFGACISCVCAVKEPGQKARFTRICTEGPAFDVATVMWHA